MAILKSSLSFLLFLFFGAAFGQSPLSHFARVSLITVSPGEELYSTFGHSAVWIYDPIQKIDKVYNYGTFDFNDPNFLPKFVRGKLDYFLSVSDSHNLIYGAKYENRGVVQQLLNLSYSQKIKIYNFLENNALPENRFYKYEFFFDNCSTRIRDGFKKTLADSLIFYPKTEKTKTFRNLIDEYLGNQKWGDFGIDLLLGTRTDEVAKPYEYMFLPDYLMNNFDGAKIMIDGKTVNLVEKKNILFAPLPKVPENNFFSSPLFIFWSLFLFVAIVTIYQFLANRYFAVFDIALFLLTGILGGLFLFAWFFTDHRATVNNLNLIWALPFNFFVAFAFVSKKWIKKLNWYFIIYAISMMLLVLFWPLLPQQLNVAFLPIILSMIFRTAYLLWINKWQWR